MNIVCATDNNFVQHCSIMLVSLLKNNSDVDVYLLTEGLTASNESIIREEVEANGGNLHVCIVDSSIVEKFPMPTIAGLSHISRATYYRLLISDLLPEEVEKAIYFDCDIIINGDLTELWECDLSDYAIAAVPQVGFGFEAERLGYPIEYGYFNAGVNVINLKYFREHGIIEELLQYIADNYSKIKFHDQDTLNGVLYNRCLHILPQWNMTSAIYVYQLKRRGDRQGGKLINDYSEEKKNALKYLNSPIVVHYVSRPKPWQKNCIHPQRKLYYKYAAETIHYKNIPCQSEKELFMPRVNAWCQERLSAVKQFFVRTDRTRY